MNNEEIIERFNKTKYTILWILLAIVLGGALLVHLNIVADWVYYPVSTIVTLFGVCVIVGSCDAAEERMKRG